MKDMYSVAADSRTADNNRYWTVFQVMSAINGGMIALSIGHLRDAMTFLPVAAVGGVLCYIWWGIQLRYALWARWWDYKLAEIEQHCKKRPQEGTVASSPVTVEVHLFEDRHLPEKGYPEISHSFLPSWGSLRIHTGLPGFSTKSTPMLVARLFCLAWLLLALLCIGFTMKKMFG